MFLAFRMDNLYFCGKYLSEFSTIRNSNSGGILLPPEYLAIISCEYKFVYHKLSLRLAIVVQPQAKQDCMPFRYPVNLLIWAWINLIQLR